MIEDLGHTAIEAHSGAEALAMLASGVKVDVVMTDHAMPAHDRLAARADPFRSDIRDLPIILATGYAELPVDPALLGLLKLAKPCSQNDIATSIHNALALRPSRENFAEPRAAR